jgi:hypothetical protein
VRVTRVSLWGGRATPWLITRWEDARTILASRGVSSQGPRPGFLTEETPPMPPGYFFGQDDPVIHWDAWTRHQARSRWFHKRGRLARDAEITLVS